MIYSTMKLNGKEILRPNDFSPKREDIYAAEITTCTGKTVADLIGWRYSDMTLSWDMLPQDQLEALIEMRGTGELEFTDADGETHLEEIIRISAVTTSTRAKDVEGNPIWKDVQVEVRFINAHN